VVAINEELATAPEKVNSDPHGAWMLRVKLKDPGQVNGLMSAADYEKYVAAEAGK
jgi:glycine cleavage system H protein